MYKCVTWQNCLHTHTNFLLINIFGLIFIFSRIFLLCLDTLDIDCRHSLFYNIQHECSSHQYYWHYWNILDTQTFGVFFPTVGKIGIVRIFDCLVDKMMLEMKSYFISVCLKLISIFILYKQTVISKLEGCSTVKSQHITWEHNQLCRLDRGSVV